MDDDKIFVSCKKNICLSVDDWLSFTRQCGELGISIDELLQSFVEDLLNCDYSYSSNRGERVFTEQWLRSAYQPDMSLLSWLLSEYIGDVDGFTELLENVKIARQELEYYKYHPEDYDTKEIAFIKTNLTDWEDTLRECKSDYMKYNPTAKWEDEVKKVLDWQNAYEKISNWKGVKSIKCYY